MSRIPFVVRRNGRYRYRRRVHFRNLCSRPVSVALLTADPGEARERSARLSVRFLAKTRELKQMIENGDYLSSEEIAELVQSELRAELERAIAPIFLNPEPARSIRQTRVFAEAYRVARRLNRPTELSEADRAELAQKGFDELEIEFIACDLDRLCAAKNITSAQVAERLERIDAYPNPTTIEQGRMLILGARAEAHRRAALIEHPTIQDAPDPVQALLAIDPAQLERPEAVTAQSVWPSPVTPEPAPDCQFITYDPRRFSSVIEELVAELKLEGQWSGDCRQQRSILRRFAWITGDRPLGSYNHLDVAAFKRGLLRLPVSFGRGDADAAMKQPFNAWIETQPAVPASEARSLKTLNRDLSTMSTVAKQLAQSAWKPKVPNTPVLDFAGAMVRIKDDGKVLRPPWKRAHMEVLFSSPLYLGGGGSKQRLKGASNPQVWHDAAYFAPLLWYYHQACREEICGLRADEVNIDHDVPHFIIKDNDVRGREEELAGEKRVARRRALPLHPELIRLGFLDYVRAIRSEGHVALFPELYLHSAKRGGAQFYGRAWVHLFHYIADRLPIPVNEAGKGPDIHSIRSLGSSFYEVDGINEIIRADIMGHARSGTNAKHYSKRIETEGLDVVLSERLTFLKKYVPVLTANVPARSIRLLPLEDRSRVGTGRHRKVRADAGTRRCD